MDIWIRTSWASLRSLRSLVHHVPVRAVAGKWARPRQFGLKKEASHGDGDKNAMTAWDGNCPVRRRNPTRRSGSWAWARCGCAGVATWRVRCEARNCTRIVATCCGYCGCAAVWLLWLLWTVDVDGVWLANACRVAKCGCALYSVCTATAGDAEDGGARPLFPALRAWRIYS